VRLSRWGLAVILLFIIATIQRFMVHSKGFQATRVTELMSPDGGGFSAAVCQDTFVQQVRLPLQKVGKVKFWDLESGLCDKEATVDVRYVAANSKANECAVIVKDKVLFYDASGVKLEKKVPHPGVALAAYSPSGTYLATASQDKVNIWGSTETELFPLKMHARTTAMAWTSLKEASGTQEVLAIGDEGGNVQLLSLDGKCRSVPMSHLHGTIVVLAWSPNGERLAVGDTNGLVTVIELASGETVARFSHESPLSALTFSPGGEFLLTGTLNQRAEIRAYSLQTGKITRIEGGRESVTFLGWHRNRLVAASLDGLVRFYTVP
jgi:WD40 repeat protein